MKTIRNQLTRKLLLGIGLLLGAGGAAVYFSTAAALQLQFDHALRAKAEAITSLTEEDRGRLELDFSDEHMRSFDAGGKDFFQLSRADGSLLERSRSLRGAELSPGVLAGLEPTFWNQALSSGERVRALGMQFHPRESAETNRAARVTLVVASVRDDLDRTLAALGWVLAGGGLSLLAITGLAVPRLLRRELAPLQELARQAAEIDAESLSARFRTANQPGELAPITARLNELLARLEGSFERERRFSSDVAHEFRTPLAELRCLAELALKVPETRSAETDREVLDITLHLEGVLKHLLALARAENNGLAAEFERVPLRPLIQGVCETIQRRAAARELTLRNNAPPMEVRSDPVLLRCVLMNLLENAVEYAPPGGAIDIDGDMKGDRVVVRVINDVHNLDERDLPRLFERFWRKEPARTQNGHAGLGLSLARSFARAMDGELTATFTGPGRLAFVLSCEQARHQAEGVRETAGS